MRTRCDSSLWLTDQVPTAVVWAAALICSEGVKGRSCLCDPDRIFGIKTVKTPALIQHVWQSEHGFFRLLWLSQSYLWIRKFAVFDTMTTTHGSLNIWCFQVKFWSSFPSLICDPPFSHGICFSSLWCLFVVIFLFFQQFQVSFKVILTVDYHLWPDHLSWLLVLLSDFLCSGLSLALRFLDCEITEILSCKTKSIGFNVPWWELFLMGFLPQTSNSREHGAWLGFAHQSD